jgi:WD40 repeat protein
VDVRRPRPRLVYTPDGRHLVFADASGKLELYDAQTNQLLRELAPTDPAPVLALAFAQGRKHLWTCRRDGRLASWSLATWQKGSERSISLPTGQATAAALDSEGRLAIGLRSGQVRLVGLAGAAPDLSTEDGEAVTALAWGAGGLLACGSKDGSVRVWTAGGTILYRFQVYSTGVGRLLFSPDGRWLFASERGQSGRMWDLQSGELVLRDFPGIGDLAGDGRRCAVSGNNRVALADLFLPDVVKHLSGGRAGVFNVAFSRDGRRLASVDSRFELSVWDVGRGVRVAGFAAPRSSSWPDNAGLALDDTGRRLGYASGGREARALLVDLDSTRRQSFVPWPLPAGYERLIHAGGRFLLVREEHATEQGGSLHSAVRELTTQGPRMLRSVLRPPEPGDVGFHDCDLSADGKYYTWVGPRRPASQLRVEVLEVATGRVVFERRLGGAGSVADAWARLTPDARSLLLDLDNNQAVYSLADRDGAARAVKSMVYPITPDGRWGVHIVRPGPNRRQGVLELRPFGRDEIWAEVSTLDALRPAELACRFSPDGRYLAFGAQDGTITVVDLPALCVQVADFERDCGLR